MNSSFQVAEEASAGTGGQRPPAFAAAASAAAITVPHALGLGLIAFAPLGGQLPAAAMALWSAALPGALLALFAPRPGVIHAPTTVVALLFANVVLTVTGLAATLGLSASQVLAVCGVTVAIGFGFQWLFGAMRLASLSRFLPVSVTHGFAAGVGLSMVVAQLSGGFGAGHFAWDSNVLLHAALALCVVVAARAFQHRWPQWPGLLPAVLLVSMAVLLSGSLDLFRPASGQATFAWPPVPDWGSVPWVEVARHKGLQLVSLAMLMAIVNSIDVLVFNQELELEHGLASEPNKALRRESLVGIVCGLCGMIPASTSASRSRIALRRAGTSRVVAPAHAAILLAVAATGFLWLQYVPMACLAGGLLLAGLMQVPGTLWSRAFARAAPATWSQGWLVAVVFVVSGGVGALVAGLVVSTFVLLHASASVALRRALLEGQLRSRRLRKAYEDVWLGRRMNEVAVFELQGVMSFGVAAHLAEQVTGMLQPRHTQMILDSSRVAAWDTTALARLSALARDLARRGIAVTVAGLDPKFADAVRETVSLAPDLDRALERAEDLLLAERPPQPDDEPSGALLGELANGLSPAGLAALADQLEAEYLAAGDTAFSAGDTGRDLHIVQAGRVTMSTAWPPDGSLRLATVGPGMTFGEMAFLSGQARTAFAGAEGDPVRLGRLTRDRFDAWAATHPRDALQFMGNLAQIGTRRLAATTRQLRAVLE